MMIFDAQRLIDAASAALASNLPCACLERDLGGWTGWPASYHEDWFTQVGTLARENPEDATLDEYHHAGTSYWSPTAPIAPRHYPYNQCGVWACVSCGRLYLRHSDEGAYHAERRIRQVTPERVIDAPLMAANVPRSGPQT